MIFVDVELESPSNGITLEEDGHMLRTTRCTLKFESGPRFVFVIQEMVYVLGALTSSCPLRPGVAVGGWTCIFVGLINGEACIERRRRMREGRRKVHGG
jgi:hypothetical protein